MSIRLSWVHATAAHLDFTWSNTQNRWHSVDNPLTLCWCSVDNLLTLCWQSFWGVAVSTHTILPIKAANTLIMDKCRITALGLYKMQHPKLLTLCWRSFSDCRWDHVAFSFAHQGCQYVSYGYQRANGIPLDLVTRSKPVDAPLTLHWCSVDAHLQIMAVTVSIALLPIEAAHALVMDNTEQMGFQWAYHRKYRSRCVDAQYQNVAVTALRSLLPTKATSLWIMNSSEQITFQLSCLHI